MNRSLSANMCNDTVDSSAYIHPTAVVEDGAHIGAGTKVWLFCHVLGEASIGRNCQLGQNVFVGNGAIIGNGCKVQNNVSVYEGVELGDFVFCGPSCVFTNDLTPRAKYPKGPGSRVRTVVGEGATIGANATVVCGHELGEWSMVAAGAVVTCDVPAHALMAGVPARQVDWVCECGAVLSEELTCLSCGREYAEGFDGLTLKHGDERTIAN